MFWRTDSGSPPNVEAGDHGATRSWSQQAAEHANGRGLSGAVRSEEAEDFALVRLQVDVVHGHEVAEALDEILDHDRALPLLFTGA